MGQRMGLQHEAPDAILKHRGIAIEQDVGANSAQLYIGRHLRLMDRHQLLDCFELEYDLISDDDVASIAAVQPNRLIDDGQRHLTPEGDTVLLELGAQAFFVRRLQQSGSELTVNFC